MWLKNFLENHTLLIVTTTVLQSWYWLLGTCIQSFTLIELHEGNFKSLYRKLKGYTTPKSRSCFCLHFRLNDDVVVSILVPGRSLLDPEYYVICTFSKGKRPFCYSESDFPCARIETTTKHRPILYTIETFRSLVEGFRGIFESTSWGEKASSHPRKQIEQNNHWVNN